jgi:tellurite resistance protein
MTLVDDLSARVARALGAHDGDEVLIQAAVCAAANVIVADGDVAGEEFQTALTDVLASPIVEPGYDTLKLEVALQQAIIRARTRFGRDDNLQRVQAVADRPVDQRERVFLIAADVADHDGIAEVEHTALSAIASALLVDKARLLPVVVGHPGSGVPASR